MKLIINQKSIYFFNNLLAQLSKKQISTINNIAECLIIEAVPITRKRNKIDKFYRCIEKIFLANTKMVSISDQRLLRRALVAKLALDLPELINSLDLPKSILLLYSESIEKLSCHLKNANAYRYGISDDFFLKDISFVLAVMVPCGAQIVELTSFFLYRSVIRALTRRDNFQAIYQFFIVNGSGPWVRIHTDSRYLSDFTEPGWDECYHRIADLLIKRQNIRGMIGSSWFYDPKLVGISPKLAYLQKRPLEGGAFFIRHGSSCTDIERATLKSETRRFLFNKGKYIPTSYSIIWPRANLINWAKLGDVE